VRASHGAQAVVGGITMVLLLRMVTTPSPVVLPLLVLPLVVLPLLVRLAVLLWVPPGLYPR
jgi:hypothetical protein